MSVNPGNIRKKFNLLQEVEKPGKKNHDKALKIKTKFKCNISRNL